MKLFLACFFLLTTGPTAFCQMVIGTEPVAANTIRPWHAAAASEYAGAYHFGESEGESTLALVVSGGLITAQVRSSDWDEQANTFRSVYQNLTRVRIEGRKFYSSEMNGEFVSLVHEGSKTYGLKIPQAGSGAGVPEQAEIGVKEGPVKLYYYGTYPQASYRLLRPDELAKYDKHQLALIRNEIFARYGYLFAKTNPLRAYFNKQDWYLPQAVDVSHCLTEIEQRNIRLLKTLEAAR